MNQIWVQALDRGMNLAHAASLLEHMTDTFAKSVCAILYEFQEVCLF